MAKFAILDKHAPAANVSRKIFPCFVRALHCLLRSDGQKGTNVTYFYIVRTFDNADQKQKQLALQLSTFNLCDTRLPLTLVVDILETLA